MWSPGAVQSGFPAGMTREEGVFTLFGSGTARACAGEADSL